MLNAGVAGLPSLLNPTYTSLLVEGMSALLMLLAGLMISAKRQSGLAVGIVGGAAGTATFTYSYLITPSAITYLAAIAALALAATLTLIYTSTAYIEEGETGVISELEKHIAQFPNVGMF